MEHLGTEIFALAKMVQGKGSNCTAKCTELGSGIHNTMKGLGFRKHNGTNSRLEVWLRTNILYDRYGSERALIRSFDSEQGFMGGGGPGPAFWGPRNNLRGPRISWGSILPDPPRGSVLCMLCYLRLIPPPIKNPVWNPGDDIACMSAMLTWQMYHTGFLWHSESVPLDNRMLIIASPHHITQTSQKNTQTSKKKHTNTMQIPGVCICTGYALHTRA